MSTFKKCTLNGFVTEVRSDAFVCVRYGPELTDVEWVRQNGNDFKVGDKVVLYKMRHASSMWYEAVKV